MKLFDKKSCFTVLASVLMAGATLPSAASANDNDSGADNAPFAMRGQQTESMNKERVLQLSKTMLLASVDVESLGGYFAQNLIQHDPLVADGRRAMLNSIQALRAQLPARTLTVKHILAERDLVFVQSHVSDTPANELTGTKRYDTYRLDHGVIVEHWMVQSRVSSRPVSGNSAFSDLYKYPVPPVANSPQRVELNRALVRALSEEVFGHRNFGLLDRMWATGYLQHNPGVGNGRAALAAVIDYIAPVGGQYRVTSTIADGDLVMVCAQIQDPGYTPNEFAGYEVCDMYRVVNFELVEHWDVAQAVPPTSASGNSMFSSLYRGHRQ